MPIDVQAGGQPGLAGGGLTQSPTLARWNAPSIFKWNVVSDSSASRCGNTPASEPGNKLLVIEANDPCGEISDAGGTLAVAFSWFPSAVEETFNGVGFSRNDPGDIITNNSATALQFVTNSNCYNQTSCTRWVTPWDRPFSRPTAMMAPTVSFAQCSVSGTAAQGDDITGVQFIYGAASGGVPGQPSSHRL